jgi:hypothetical protein
VITLTPVVSARFRLLVTRAALPAWILAVLAFIADAEDVSTVVRDLFPEIDLHCPQPIG